MGATATPGDQVPAGPDAPAPTVLDWVLVVAICLFGAVGAAMAFFYLPLYVGDVPVPVSIVVVAWLAWALPRAVYRLTGSLAAAAAPAAVVFAVIFGLLLLPNALDLQRPPRVILAQWRVLVLIGAMAVAAAASLSLLWGEGLARRLAADRRAADVTPVTPEVSGADPTACGGDTGGGQ